MAVYLIDSTDRERFPDVLKECNEIIHHRYFPPKVGC